MAAPKAATQSKFDRMPWTDEFLAHQKPFTYADMDDFIEVWCHTGGELAPFWDPDFSAAMCPVFIGEAGVGKSFRMWKIAQRKKMEYRRVPMGDSQEEDNMGVISREVDEHGHHKFTLPKWMPTEPPDSESNLGICFLDEIGTGENGHQNLTSIMLTDGYRNGIFGHLISAGWFFFGAMNPDNQHYHLNQQMDTRLKDRLFPIYVKPTHEEILYMLTRLNKLPKTLHGFLRLNTPHIGVVSPRSWEQIGAFWARYDATSHMRKDQMLNAIRLKLPPDTVGELARYIELGDNPNNYPMSAQEIMNATPNVVDQYVARMKEWGKTGRDVLVSATGYDLAAYFNDEDFEFSDAQMEASARVVEVIPNTALMQQIMDAATGTRKSQQIAKFLTNKEAAIELGKMMDRNTQHLRDAGR